MPALGERGSATRARCLLCGSARAGVAGTLLAEPICTGKSGRQARHGARRGHLQGETQVSAQRHPAPSPGACRALASAGIGTDAAAGQTPSAPPHCPLSKPTRPGPARAPEARVSTPRADFQTSRYAPAPSLLAGPARAGPHWFSAKSRHRGVSHWAARTSIMGAAGCRAAAQPTRGRRLIAKRAFLVCQAEGFSLVKL